MSDRPRIYPRIERRETHSPRSVSAIVLAVVLVVALAYLATEILLAALGAHALLLSPAAMVRDIAALPSASSAAVGIVGGAAALVGLVLLVAAVTPGRRARHVQRSERAVVVIDDEVIASALVRAAADVSSLDPDRAVGIVGRRRAQVRITPSSGRRIDRDAVAEVVRDRIAAWGLVPALTPTITVERTGKVGS